MENVKNEKVPTRASVLDAIILAGGTFEELIAQANAQAEPLRTKVKTYTKALLKVHMNYRAKKNPHFWDAVKVTDDGIYPVEK